MIKKFLVLLCFFCSFTIQAADIDCAQYHDGFFEYDGKHDGTIVYRKGDYQLEYNILSNKWTMLKLEWISDCEYNFTYYKTNKDGHKNILGTMMIVKIIAVDESGYEYYAHYPKDSNNYTGRLIYAEKGLSKKEKSKILKQYKKTSK